MAKGCKNCSHFKLTSNLHATNIDGEKIYEYKCESPLCNYEPNDWLKAVEEIEQLRAELIEKGGVYEHSAYGLDYAFNIVDKYRKED